MDVTSSHGGLSRLEETSYGGKHWIIFDTDVIVCISVQSPPKSKPSQRYENLTPSLCEANVCNCGFIERMQVLPIEGGHPEGNFYGH